MKNKAFTVVRIELGVIESESLEQAINDVNEFGFNVGFSSEKVLPEDDPDNNFWANLDVDRVEFLKSKFDFDEYAQNKNYSLYSFNGNFYIKDLNKKENILIKEKIFDEELFEYRIADREDLVQDLIQWISESSNQKDLMMEDLKMLLTWEDDYIFSSISTNEYVRQKDSQFDDLCKELIELNKTIKDD